MARGDSIPLRGSPTVARTTKLKRDVVRMREKVEKLTGERGDIEKSLSVIRRSELRPLASLTLMSTQVLAAPTMEEFNALQTDVANIFDALQRISNQLGNAVIPKV